MKFVDAISCAVQLDNDKDEQRLTDGIHADLEAGWAESIDGIPVSDVLTYVRTVCESLEADSPSLDFHDLVVADHWLRSLDEVAAACVARLDDIGDDEGNYTEESRDLAGHLAVINGFAEERLRLTARFDAAFNRMCYRIIKSNREDFEESSTDLFFAEKVIEPTLARLGEVMAIADFYLQYCHQSLRFNNNPYARIWEVKTIDERGLTIDERQPTVNLIVKYLCAKVDCFRVTLHLYARLVWNDEDVSTEAFFPQFPRDPQRIARKHFKDLLTELENWYDILLRDHEAVGHLSPYLDRFRRYFGVWLDQGFDEEGDLDDSLPTG